MKKNNLLVKVMLSAMLTSVAGMSAYAQHAETMDVNAGYLKYDSNPENYSAKQIPQNVQQYKWDNDEWMLEKSYVMEYNDMFKYKNIYETYYYDGYVAEYLHFAFEYDDMQRVARMTERNRYSSMDEWLNYKLTDYSYDNVISDFVIKEDVLLWDEMCEDWLTSSGYYFEITRDENNRVLSKVIWDSSSKRTAYKAFFYEYADETGPAVSIRVDELNENNETVPSLYYTDIVWEKSDCQYINEYNNKFFIWSMDDNNKIKSMTISKFDKNNDIVFDANIYTIWDEKGRKLMTTLYSADGMNRLNIYKYDECENGASDYMYCTWTDANGNHKYDEGEKVYDFYSFITEYDYDEYGNMTREENKGYNEETGAFDIDKYMYTNSYVYLEDGTLQEHEKVTYKKGKEHRREKTVYSDFIKPVPTAVEEIEDNGGQLAQGMPYVVYDMNGTAMKQETVTDARNLLEGLPHGVYVVCSGSKKIKMVR